MIRIAGMRVPLSYNQELLEEKAAARLGILPDRIERILLSDRAIDATDREDIHYKVTLQVWIKPADSKSLTDSENEIIWSLRDKKITRAEESLYKVPEAYHTGKTNRQRPVVVGCGPAGMFAALILAEAGACPILLERGMDVDSRRKSVLSFWRTGLLDTSSNVQFGEGGAGTFSDGKLKIGKRDARKMKILQEFVSAGAPPEILFDSKPHIGTDRLHDAVKAIVGKIRSLGGEVHYQSNMTQLMRSSGKIKAVGYVKDGVYTELSTDQVILAIGHSARDTFAYLEKTGIQMEQKPFAVGVRIEHPQELINKIQYGSFAGDPRLGAADYRMVVHLPDKKGVYTFCMCPGGSVVAAASEEGGLVTNGMSKWKRDGKNANTAILVTVDKSDLQSDHPMAGVLFQRAIEAAAFKAGGSNYKAPVQRLGDFLEGKNSSAFGDVLPTYRPGTEFAPVESYLPPQIAGALRKGLVEMGDWMPGYSFPDALLTGAETRSTSPVRMIRSDTLEAAGIKGLYPCGEGAGYAGGIVSAAVDGILCAEQVLRKE